MRTIISYVVSFVLGILIFTAAGYGADFSADMVSSTPEGALMAKIFVADNKTRVEMGEVITISRIDKKVAWILMPEQKLYMEQPIDMRQAASTQEKVEGEIERKEEGRETINGMNTVKYRVTFEAEGRRDSVFQWIDESMHFPVKTASIDGSWSSEFKNINSGAQDDKLFEIPSGYNKMSFGME